MEENRIIYSLIGTLSLIVGWFLKSFHKEYTEEQKKIKSDLQNVSNEIQQLKTHQQRSEEYTRREIENIRELIDLKLEGVVKEVRSGLERVITIVEQKTK